MSSLNERVGRVCKIKATKRNSAKQGNHYPLPEGVTDGGSYKITGWSTFPDGHCTGYSVATLEGKPLAGLVWSAHISNYGAAAPAPEVKADPAPEVKAKTKAKVK